MDLQSDNELYPAGTVIAGDYEIVNHLASGGMAHVYIALQRKLGRKVALKVLNSTCCANHSVVSRFVNEARIVAKLHHPHIVEVYDVGETEDHRSFMAMELLEGKSLGDRIKEGVIPPSEAFPIVREVAESLAEAHSQGVIHRDLKPDNIFLTIKSGVKTLDFGIAKVLHGDNNGTEERLTRAGTAPGTPEYMSPEQARGQDLDARSDLYSLGVVLYEMLCGHPPFEEPTFLATILKQVQSPPPPLPDFVPQPLGNYIINRLLTKDPNCRPENANAFISELDELSIKLNLKVDEALQGQSLMNALTEIEQLKLQLAVTQQELQRSRDMACLDESDLKGEDNSKTPSEPVPMLGIKLGPTAGGEQKAGGLGVVVNPNLGNPVPASNRQSFIEPRGNGESVAGNQSSLPKAGAGGATTAGMPLDQVVSMGGGNNAQQSSMGQGLRSGVMPVVPGNAGPAMGQPVRSGVMPVVPGNAGPAMGQPVRSGVMPVVPGNAPNPAMGQPVRSGVMPVVPGNAGPAMGQPVRSGVMPVVPGNAPGQPGGMNQGVRSGVMPAVPGNAPGQPGGMNQGVRSGMMPAVPRNAPSQPGSMNQGVRSGMMPAVAGNAGPAMGQPMARGGGSSQMNRSVSRGVGGQNVRQDMNNVMPGNKMPSYHGSVRPGSQQAMRPAFDATNSYAGGVSASESMMEGMPTDAVMAPQSIDVMRSLEQSARENGVRKMNDVPAHDIEKEGDVWQPNQSEFYGSGVMVDDEAHFEGGSRYPGNGGGRRDGHMNQDMRERSASERYYGADNELAGVPQPRYSTAQGQRMPSMDGVMSRRSVSQSSGSRPSVERRGEDSGYGRGERRNAESGYGRGERRVSESGSGRSIRQVDTDDFRSQPRDVLTGRPVRRNDQKQNAMIGKQEIFMTFSSPLTKIFGHERASDMLHFSQGIWNAVVMGSDAISELRSSFESNPGMLKLVDGMIGRKQKLFDTEHWLIDELEVSTDVNGRLTLNFLVMEVE